MPYYEYFCEDCELEFEEFQKITDEPINECPNCSGENVKKLIGKTSFKLKGRGWYKDGYSSTRKGK